MDIRYKEHVLVADQTELASIKIDTHKIDTASASLKCRMFRHAINKDEKRHSQVFGCLSNTA